MHCVRTEHRVFNVWLAGSCLYVKAYHFHLSSAFFSVDFSYFTRKREIQSVTGKWKDEKNKIYILIFSPTLQTKDYDQCFPRSWPAFAVPPPPARLPAFMAQTWAVWEIIPTTVLFISFFKFVWFPSNSRAFVCSLLQSEYDGKWVSLINIDVDVNAKSAYLSWQKMCPSVFILKKSDY